ncbi:MAG: DUF6173 family protein [Planktomarina sp.]
MSDQIKTTAEAIEAAALPRVHETHQDRAAPKLDATLPKGAQGKAVDQKSAAEWAYERLIMYIQNFEKTLDGDHEIAMGFTGGDVGVIRIEGMGFFDPDIITFYGTDSGGGKTQLIQHVSQLNVMLRALPKIDQTGEANRIGFRLAEDLEGPEA